MIRLIPLLTLMAVLAYSSLEAKKQLNFKQITTNNGLKHNNITDIIQDHQGFLWFGTENGLHRFDGEDIKVFIHKSNDSTTIAGNVIYEIFKDRNKTLWVATNAGFNKFNREKENFTRIGLLQNSNTSKEITYEYYVPATAESKNGEIYVSWGNHGIWKYKDNKKILVPFPVEDKAGSPFKMGNIVEMFIDSDNNLWMGSKSEGLFLFDHC